MNENSSDVIKTGIEFIVAAFLLFIVLTMTISGRKWYFKEKQLEGFKRDMTTIAEEYVMVGRDYISGADIIEYIVKHGSIYDYDIDFNSRDKDDPLYDPLNKEEIKKGNPSSHWTEYYLEFEVFNNDKTLINGRYSVKIERNNEQIVKYNFKLLN